MKADRKQISKEAFSDWLKDPVTEAVFQYLHDFKKTLAEGVTLAILAGLRLSYDEQLEVHTRIEMLDDLSSLSFEDIESFYAKEEYASKTP